MAAHALAAADERDARRLAGAARGCAARGGAPVPRGAPRGSGRTTRKPAFSKARHERRFGSSTADAASQSKIFIEAQRREGYDDSFSVAITCAPVSDFTSAS